MTERRRPLPEGELWDQARVTDYVWGDPARVHAFATELGKLGDELAEIAAALAGARTEEFWSGDAANAFAGLRSRVEPLLQQVTTLATATSRPLLEWGGALRDFQGECQAGIDRGRQAWHAHRAQTARQNALQSTHSLDEATSVDIDNTQYAAEREMAAARRDIEEAEGDRTDYGVARAGTIDSVVADVARAVGPGVPDPGAPPAAAGGGGPGGEQPGAGNPGGQPGTGNPGGQPGAGDPGGQPAPIPPPAAGGNQGNPSPGAGAAPNPSPGPGADSE